jgi:hypothetical protein
VSSEKETLAQQPTEVLKEMLRMYRDFMKTATRATPFEAHSVELIELILSERERLPFSPHGAGASWFKIQTRHTFSRKRGTERSTYLSTCNAAATSCGRMHQRNHIRVTHHSIQSGPWRLLHAPGGLTE